MSMLITTKFLAPTNTRGPRVKATGFGRTVTVTWDHSRDTSANHLLVTDELISIMKKEAGTNYKIVDYASLHDSSGYAVIVK